MTVWKFSWTATTLAMLLAGASPAVDCVWADESTQVAGDSASIDDDDDDEDKDDEDKDDDNDKDDDADAQDDGKELLPQAKLTFEQAKAAALAAAPGSTVEEVDLETVDGQLVFDVDMGDKTVRIDAVTGAVVSISAEDEDKDDSDQD